MIHYHGPAAKADLCDALAKARAFPRRSESRESFLRSIKGLNALKGKKGKIQIYSDWAHHSFCWSACGMFGGFIYHHSSETWAIHT